MERRMANIRRQQSTTVFRSQVSTGVCMYLIGALISGLRTRTAPPFNDGYSDR